MKIAVTHCGEEEKQSVYLDWLLSFAPNAEWVTVAAPGTEEGLFGYHGLVLTGGGDVDPFFSKAEPADLVRGCDRDRDTFEFRLIGEAMKHRVPMLGICRGMQVVNVYFGGTLAADLVHDEHPDHETPAGRSGRTHTVEVYAATLLRSLTGAEEGTVNTFHHQGVKELGGGLAVSSCSEDGVPESLEWSEKGGKPFLLAVQWHPERMADRGNPFTTAVGEAFVRAVQLNAY